MKLICAKDTAVTNGKVSLVQVDALQFQIAPTHTELTMQQRRCWMITLAGYNLVGDIYCLGALKTHI